jgi:hypothetical protein
VFDRDSLDGAAAAAFCRVENGRPCGILPAMMRTAGRWMWGAIAASVWAAAVPRGAAGQTGPNLLVNPWQTGQAVDTSTDAIFHAATHSDPGNSVQFNSYSAYGRWRIFPDSDATPRLGYDVLYYDINTTDRSLPGHLWDTSVGFAQPVARLGKYFAVVTAAVGYSGDTPYSDPHAVYYTANFLVGRQFSDNKALIFDLNYDGNRTFLPDVPIPAVEYKDRVNEYFDYTIGAPINSLTYRPLTGLQVDFGWELVETFSARVGYSPDRHLEVYGEYVDRLTGFHVSANPDPDSRLFFQERRAGIGFGWKPTKLIRVSVAGGWSFGNEFYRGFDVRNYDVVRHLSDGPYGQVRLEIGF